MGNISCNCQNKNSELEHDVDESKIKELIECIYVINCIKKIQRTFKKKLRSSNIIQKDDNKVEEHIDNIETFQNFKSSSPKILSNVDMKSNSYLGKRNENGLRIGFGINKWKNGTEFIGLFSNDKANGLGIFKLHDSKDEYKGEFKNDKANGFGLYSHSNAFYVGEWVNDFQEGLGDETWNDGSNYKGEYRKGKKEGLGVYIWNDGSMYEGYWKDNLLHGYGKYNFKDTRVYIGEWKNNSMDGYGEFYWKDGNKYIGYYKNDKKNGFGIYYWASANKIYIGFWYDGKQDGIGKYISGDKERYGYWKKGNKTKWYDSEKDAFSELKVDQRKYRNFLKMNILQVRDFLDKE